MSQRERTINHCDICGHEWIAKPGVVYTHCTSGKCRSRKWDRKDIPATGEEGKAPAAKAVAILLEKRPHLKPKLERVPHDSKTCRIYKCGMCAAAK